MKSKKASLIFGLLIILIIALFVLPRSLSLFKSDFSSTPTSYIPPKNDPVKVSQTFYDNYFECIKKHFQSNTGKSPAEDCPYDSNPHTTDDFATNVSKNIGGDPILCAQNLPLSISTSNSANIMGDEVATVIVHEKFSESYENVQVILKNINNEWKLYTVICSPQEGFGS